MQQGMPNFSAESCTSILHTLSRGEGLGIGGGGGGGGAELFSTAERRSNMMQPEELHPPYGGELRSLQKLRLLASEPPPKHSRIAIPMLPF